MSSIGEPPDGGSASRKQAILEPGDVRLSAQESIETVHVVSENQSDTYHADLDTISPFRVICPLPLREPVARQRCPIGPDADTAGSLGWQSRHFAQGLPLQQGLVGLERVLHDVADQLVR